MKNAVEIKNLNFNWIDGINMVVKKGSIAVIIDSERVTSMRIMNILSGEIPSPKNAKIRYFGEEKRDGKRIAYLQPYIDINSEISVRKQLIKWGDSLRLLDSEKDIDRIIKDLELENLENKKIKDLNYNEKQWVKFASSMIFNPDLILVNHFIENLNLRNREKFLRIISLLNRRYGKTILIAERSLGECLQMAERVWVINNREFIGIEDEMTFDKTGRYIKIKGRPMGLIAVCMEELNLTYYVDSKESIMVLDERAQVHNIVEMLVKRNIKIDSIYEVKENLADKVKRIIEGDKNNRKV